MKVLLAGSEGHIGKCARYAFDKLGIEVVGADKIVEEHENTSDWNEHQWLC